MAPPRQQALPKQSTEKPPPPVRKRKLKGEGAVPLGGAAKGPKASKRSGKDVINFTLKAATDSDGLSPRHDGAWGQGCGGLELDNSLSDPDLQILRALNGRARELHDTIDDINDGVAGVVAITSPSSDALFEGVHGYAASCENGVSMDVTHEECGDYKDVEEEDDRSQPSSDDDDDIIHDEDKTPVVVSPLRRGPPDRGAVKLVRARQLDDHRPKYTGRQLEFEPDSD